MLEHFKKISPQYITRNYSSGSSILSHDETPTAAYVLLSGIVRTFNISEHGEEQTINFHTPGEFFPSSWIFDKTSACIYFYEAFNDAEICLMPKEKLRESFESSKATRSLLTDYLTSSYTTSQFRVAALEQPKAQDKIVLSFYYLSQKFGQAQPDGGLKIAMRLTHRDIASLIGATRETASTELHKLKEMDILNYEHQQFYVNMNKLTQYIKDYGFDILPSDIH